MTLPISPELTQQLAALSPTQLAWLSGYAWAQSQGVAAPSAVVPNGVPTTHAVAPARTVTVLSASQTGNARRVAEEVLVKLESAGVNAKLVAAGDFKSKSLVDEDIVLLVTSTQGEGEPPEEAVPLHKFLFGKKAPNLSRLHFAVLGLGDTSYPNFCQAGKDFDAQLAILGGTRLLDRVDCDLDYQPTATAWQDAITATVADLAARAGDVPAAAVSVAAAPTQKFDKESPFSATLSVRQKITSRHAAKDVEHIEIDLSDSGIQYQTGDALGVYYQNDPALVAEILQHTQVNRDDLVRLVNGEEVPIETALRAYLDITQTTPALVKTYAQWVEQADLRELAADAAQLNEYIADTPPVGVFADYPHVLAAQGLHDLFRPLTPRLYSIASAQAEVGEEVHITVGVVRFEHHATVYTGGASGYLGARLDEGEAVRVFIERNPNFRLPENGDTPIIMIGAGTGVAPFRAFMQQREANGDGGENWLVFGNQKFTDDFLYQAEWQQYRKNGLLHKYDFAWSREGSEKVYVQHKLREEAAEVWAWLQRGAHVYVCGDATKMARDVEHALLDIIAEQGKLSAEDADDYLNELREDKRYQRDVY
nr:assimilatory sulfite reductase (NADPH) flavoprotein subunit [Snodgrassella sp. CFCC 13594]